MGSYGVASHKQNFSFSLRTSLSALLRTVLISPSDLQLRFIEADIRLSYRYLVAVFTFMASLVVFFPPTGNFWQVAGGDLSNRMFLLKAKRWKSSKWMPHQDEDVITMGQLRLL